MIGKGQPYLGKLQWRPLPNPAKQEINPNNGSWLPGTFPLQSRVPVVDSNPKRNSPENPPKGPDSPRPGFSPSRGLAKRAFSWGSLTVSSQNALESCGKPPLRRIFLVFPCLALLAVSGFADADEWDSVRNRLASGVLRWGGDAEGGAPFQMRDKDNLQKVVGFEVELADALADELARRLEVPLSAEFAQYEWMNLSEGLARGDFDIILSGFEITETRRQAMGFSRPYYRYGQQLVVRRDENRVKGLTDLRDKLVGTLAGSASDRYLTEQGIPLQTYSGQVEPYFELEIGRLDAVLLDNTIVAFYADTNPRLKRLGAPMGHGNYAIAARLEDADLLAAIDQALGELIVSGRLREILRKWRIWNEDQVSLAQGPRASEERDALRYVADEPPAPDAVDRDVVAASAQSWTFDRYAPTLAAAAGMTIFLTVASMAVAMVLGLAIALGRLYGPRWARWLLLAYVEFFRGVPMLLVLWFLYYALAGLGLGLPAIVAAIAGFGLNYAAYESENHRGSILAVPVKQWEAARALGMSERMAFRRVVFPQALRTALGPMTNDFVALFKDTSLVSVISIGELTKEYMILSRSSLKFAELGLLTAALYLAMSVPLSYLSRYLERRWRGA